MWSVPFDHGHGVAVSLTVSVPQPTKEETTCGEQ